MKTYTTQAGIKADIKDSVLRINEDVTFQVSFKINADIKVNGNITASNIDAGNIDANDIIAGNIDAYSITAGDIIFFAVCYAYEKLICKSIKGERENSKYFCLDSEVEIKK